MKYAVVSLIVSLVLAIIKIKKQIWKKKIEKTLAEELSQCDNIVKIDWNSEE